MPLVDVQSPAQVPNMANFLSKTRLMSARQCLKRLHLENHRPELARISPATQAAFRTGIAVGEVARKIYGTEDSAIIPYGGGLKHALQKTARLLREQPARPLFEATLQYGGVLVRVDVLLPEDDGWRMVEVKASTSQKDEHVFDCAVQAWVLQGLGHNLQGIALAHVDKRFEYKGNGDYGGLLTEVDMREPVAALLPAIPAWIRKATRAGGPNEPDIRIGSQCNKPYDCPFMAHCWPSDTEYPVQQLPRATKATLAAYIDDGYKDVRDVPTERLTEKQRRVQRVAIAGRAELLPGAGEYLDSLEWPRYHLDFETIAPAIPIWAGTRPYEVLPVQWSCHFQKSPGKIEHSEFLDLTGDPPMRRLAESLIRTLGNSGPVFMYTRYEERVIKSLIERFEDLAVGLAAITNRLIDLAPLVEQHFYAPSMAGSWSIKALLPAISTSMDYKHLVGIQEGTAASEGYLEIISPGITELRRAELKEQLLRYCRFDTEAMVRLADFLTAGEAG